MLVVVLFYLWIWVTNVVTKWIISKGEVVPVKHHEGVWGRGCTSLSIRNLGCRRTLKNSSRYQNESEAGWRVSEPDWARHSFLLGYDAASGIIRSRRFEGTYFLHFQGSVQDLWAFKGYVPSELVIRLPREMPEVRYRHLYHCPEPRNQVWILREEIKLLPLLEIGSLFVPCLARGVVTIPTELPWLMK